MLALTRAVLADFEAKLRQVVVKIPTKNAKRSQEVEKVIMEHDGVLEVSVVGVPDERWGEVPKAFVMSREGSSVSEEEIITFTRDRIAHFKAPKYVEFGELPKTATGKIQKYVLRDKEWEGKEKRIQGSSLT